MKRFKHKKTASQKKISKIFANSKTPGRAKNQYFEELTFGEIRNTFSMVARHPFFFDAIYLSKATGVKDFFKAKTPSASLEKNLAWCMALIEHHKVIIQYALNQDIEIRDAILSEQYSQAISILDEIDLSCGISLWSIYLRGAIESDSQEVPPKKSMSSIKGVSQDPLFNYLVNYGAGYHNDPDIFFTATKTNIFEIERSAPEPIKDYLLYSLFWLDQSKDYNFNNIFNIVKDTSILDVFYLVLDYLIYTTGEVGSKYLSSYPVKHLILDLGSNFTYPAIQGLSNYFGYDSVWKEDKKALDLIDLYTVGNYDEVCMTANEAGCLEYGIPILELIAKANIRSGKLMQSNAFCGFFSLMQDVYFKGEEYKKSLETLACEASKYKGIGWYRQLLLFTKREAPFIRSIEKRNYDNMLSVYSDQYGPKKVNIIGEDLKDKYFDHLHKVKDESSSLKLFYYLYKNDSNKILKLEIDEIRKKKYYALSLLEKKNYDDAVNSFNLLIKCEDTITRVECARYLVEALLLAGRNEEAIEEFVNISLSNENIFSTFDTKRILSVAKDYATQSDSINIPIAYSLHSRFKDSEYDPNLKLAFETFLIKNNAVYPEDLFGREEEFTNEKLYYFLKWVCTPSVMKLYFSFESVRHTEESRLKVCKYLMEQGDNDEYIKNEAKEINRSHIIRRAVKKVENSRIYVDTSTFNGRDSQQYRSLFEKYIELSSQTNNEANDDNHLEKVLDPLRIFLEEDGVNYWKALSMVHLQDFRISSKNSTFLNLIKLMRSEFAYGGRGLNNHLSTRIRHGVLPTALRKPVIDEDLYFSQSATQETINDSKWGKEAWGFKESENSEIISIICEFSKKYEKLISELNDERLQVYILEEELVKPKGAEKNQLAMFNYSTSLLESYAIQKELPISPSYNDFVKVTNKWLWDRTDYNLMQVQGYIKNDFLKQVVNLFDELKAEVVRKFDSNGLVSDFCNSVDRAKANLNSQIDVICSWFAHTDYDDKEEYEIDTSIDIARSTLNVDVEFICNDTYVFSERTLSYMVDVFFIIFENAISKSNIPKSQLRIKLRVFKDDEGFLVIQVENNCNLDGSVTDLNKKLKFYQDAYGNESLIKGVLQKEGGTGFFKLWKILEKDLEIKHSAEMYFKENSDFVVKLILVESKVLRIKRL
ncbi:hypothetical protein [Halomonas sp. SpR8]|uniref:hypothetical protein n=1 Tax=Halomonas sp. SpR8 TaxID=3050463 RepID=UPI0027E4875B|nr:hypothetical protein [Halomonas sp. SpR8]MDQ7727918.1 hypothetical protein [Halomonas sp. SpR8]